MHSYSYANEAQASTKMYIKIIISFQNAEFALTIYRDKFSNLLQQFLPTFPLPMKRHSFLQMGKESQSLQDGGFGKQNGSVSAQITKKRRKNGDKDSRSIRKALKM